MKVYRWSIVIFPLVLNLNIRERGDWLASRPTRFIPVERVADAYRIGVWFGLKVGLDKYIDINISQNTTQFYAQYIQYTIYLTTTCFGPF